MRGKAVFTIEEHEGFDGGIAFYKNGRMFDKKLNEVQFDELCSSGRDRIKKKFGPFIIYYYDEEYEAYIVDSMSAGDDDILSDLESDLERRFFHKYRKSNSFLDVLV